MNDTTASWDPTNGLYFEDSSIPVLLKEILTSDNATHNFRNKAIDAIYGLSPHVENDFMDLQTDQEAIVFITRPQLNLSGRNIVNSSDLGNLLVNSKLVIEDYVRHVLDPRLARSSKHVKSKLLYDHQPFIPILTNSLKTISGWPSNTAQTFTTKAGRVKEQTMGVDGTPDTFGVEDLTLTFKNMDQNIIEKIITTWMTYQWNVKNGLAVPYPDMIIRREIDSQCRIYIIVTSPDGTIRKFANTGVSIPVNNNSGQMFDYKKGTHMGSANKETTIRFKSSVFEYNKVAGMLDFNAVVSAFNTKMKPNEIGVIEGMSLVPDNLYKSFRNRMIPRINLETAKLEWYIDEDYIEFKPKKMPKEKINV